MIQSPVPGLITLVYELLDAHRDTVELGTDLPEDAWQAHLDYLRALQRKGREVLARAAGSDRPTYPSEGRRW